MRRFCDFTEGEMGFGQRLLSHGTLTGKVSPLFSGPKSYHQLVTFSTGIGPKRDPKTGPSFSTFLNFFASKSHFFGRRTSSHVGWIVIIRWRLRAPCLQVLSSL